MRTTSRTSRLKSKRPESFSHFAKLLKIKYKNTNAAITKINER